MIWALQNSIFTSHKEEFDKGDHFTCLFHDARIHGRAAAAERVLLLRHREIRRSKTNTNLNKPKGIEREREKREMELKWSYARE